MARRFDKFFGYEFRSRRQRRRLLWHFYWTDHGWIRIWWWNLAQVAPGVWRSNQPSPRRLRRYRDLGIRTVVNLRGSSRHSHGRFEQSACERLGLELITVKLRARNLVDRDRLLLLLDLFERLERPFIMHCKSGADRAGLASALYLLHIEGVDIAEARRQLSLRFAHVRQFRTGILDYMLDAYETDFAARPVPVREWIETRYDPEALTAAYERGKGVG